MSQSLIQLASFETDLEAEIARGALEHEGIRAFVHAAHEAHTLSHIGSAHGGARLMVSAEDVAQAAKIMERLAREAELDKAPWYCGVCREDVEATFDICWSCQGDRAKVEIQRPYSPAEPGNDNDSER